MTTVSRWLVMPMAAMSAGFIPALRIAARAVATTLFQISSASCSTQPDFGKYWRNSFCAKPLSAQRSVEDEGARRGRALIDGENIAGHERLTPSPAAPALPALSDPAKHRQGIADRAGERYS